MENRLVDIMKNCLKGRTSEYFCVMNLFSMLIIPFPFKLKLLSMRCCFLDFGKWKRLFLEAEGTKSEERKERAIAINKEYYVIETQQRNRDTTSTIEQDKTHNLHNTTENNKQQGACSVWFCKPLFVVLSCVSLLC
jgi:hypothetical protein